MWTEITSRMVGVGLEGWGEEQRELLRRGPGVRRVLCQSVASLEEKRESSRKEIGELGFLSGFSPESG